MHDRRKSIPPEEPGSTRTVVTRHERKAQVLLLKAARELSAIRYMAECKALASDLARQWVAWGGKEPPGRPAEDVIRAMR
jgi:hypothetical protein